MSVSLPSVSGPNVSGPGVSGSAPPVRPPTSALRLIATLALAGAVAGFFIVLVHQWSQPRIEAWRARVLAEAVDEVLAGPAEVRVLFLEGGAFTATPSAAADTAVLDRVWEGRDADGRVTGIAAVAAEAGFQDVIRLIFGYDPGSRTVLGMKVLESKETPGLGDRIEKDSLFVGEFAGVAVPLVGVKAGKATGAAGEVDMITGATISSQAIIDIINHRLEALRGPLDGYAASGDAGGRP